jgi:ABC-type nitrate/sulfonate/bicarbonate transport system ATPase subunit
MKLNIIKTLNRDPQILRIGEAFFRLDETVKEEIARLGCERAERDKNALLVVGANDAP